MFAVRETIVINASAEDVFDLIHNYPRRLEWDSFLREASLCGGATEPGLGVSAYCAARRAVGGLAMETVYITFDRPRVAAVRMTRGPFFLDFFAASLCHEDIDANTSRVTYVFRFRVRPRLKWFGMEPLVAWVFRRETRQRLQSLKTFLERPGVAD